MIIRKKPKWRRKPEERPRQILAAALERFGEVGVASATLDEIADRAGVTKGTIYLYFPNKEELFRRAVAEALERARAEVSPPQLRTATEQLDDSLAHLWSFLTSSHGEAVRGLVNTEQGKFPELAALYGEEVIDPFERKVVEIIRRGIDTGHFRELAPEVAARMLTALVLQHADWHHFGLPALKNKTGQVVLRELLDFYLQAIAATDAAFPQADGAPGPRGALNS